MISFFRLTKNRGLSGVEITPVNGDSEPTSSLIADMAQRKKPAQGSGSKLESALDKLGMNKRKLSEGTTEDKSKKKISHCFFYISSFLIFYCRRSLLLRTEGTNPQFR